MTSENMVEQEGISCSEIRSSMAKCPEDNSSKESKCKMAIEILDDANKSSSPRESVENYDDATEYYCGTCASETEPPKEEAHLNSDHSKYKVTENETILSVEMVHYEKKDELGEDDNLDSDGNQQDENRLPIDRGWAWMILAGSFLNIILMVGYGRAIGILFVEYINVFESSATKTTLFMGVMAGTFSISSLFSMNILLQIIGARKMVLLGGTISTAGMLSAVFATSITYLICTHSILIGIGHSMINGPGLVLIGQYFKKRRGFATAIAMSGISIGGSVFPPLIRYFVDEYGVRGSMLLLTGMTMNMWVGGLLYRPLDSFRKRKQQETEDTSGRKDVSGSNDCLKEEFNVESKRNGFITSPEQQNGTLSTDHQQEGEATTLMGNIRKRIRNTSDHGEHSKPDLSQSQLLMFSSNPDVASMSMLDVRESGQNLTGSSKHLYKPKRFCDYLKMAVTSLDFSMFKNPMFQLIVATSNVAVVFGLAGIYLPALAMEKGVPATEASFLLTICGTIDFFSRLAVGYTADLRCMKVHHLMAIGLILSGAVSHFTHFYNSYGLMIVYSVLIGLFGSFYHCLVPVYIVEFMGLENMAKVLGFVSLFHGLSASLTHPIMGAIRDVTGSYDVCFNYIGVCNFIAAICLFCEPLARRRLRKLYRNSDPEANEEHNPLKQETN